VKQFKEEVLPGPEEQTESKGLLPKKRKPKGFTRYIFY